VRFVNEDRICHRFFASSKHNEFDLGLLQPGTSNEWQFQHPGVVHVYCSLHVGKQATILIVPTPYFAVVRPTGEFAIENLAPGTYDLETWSEGVPRQRIRVDVRPWDTEIVRILVEERHVRGSG